MGSKSKSKSSQTTINTTKDNSAVVEDEGINITDVSEEATITIERLDDEVVNRSFDFAEEFGGEVIGFGKESLDFADGALKESFDFGEKSLEFVEGSSERNANIINAATLNMSALTGKVIDGLFEDRADTRENSDSALIESLGKYSSIIFIGGAAAAAYAVARR